MVYTKLYIVTGLLLNKQQIMTALKDLAEVSFEGMDEDCINEELTDLFREHFIKTEGELWKKHGGQYPTLFSFPCCSESAGKLFILGYKIHTYYRKHLQCKKCGEYTVCDRCIGETSNGWYDIDKIFNGPVRILREKICRLCHSDQVEVNHRCKLCFIDNPEADQSRLSYQEERINRFAKESLKMMPDTYVIAHYYLIDDCLSCT